MSQFNTERAIRDIQEMAYPRFVGTEGERKAAGYIEKEFEKAGLEVSEESFTYSLLPVKVFRKAGHLLQACLVLLVGFLVGVRPVLSFVFSIVLFVFLCLATQWSKFLGSSMSIGTKHPSRNLVASSEGSVSERKVILMAHYDSKSQFFPMRLRIFILTVSIFGSMIFSLGVIGAVLGVMAFGFSVPSSFFLYSGLFLSFFPVSLVFNRTGNDSPGVVDNASGVAVMLELARVFSEEPSEDLDFQFVATSAEEIGLIGSISFLEEHREELDEGKVFLINLDALGTGEIIYNSGYGLPVTSTSHFLNGLIEEVAEEKKIDVKGEYLPTGLAADHMPFVENGFEATWLHSSMSTVHTEEDSLKQINKDSLGNAGKLVQELVYKLKEVER